MTQRAKRSTAGLSIAVSIAAAALAGTGAAADGVVIESSSARYEIGDRIAAGARVSLTGGETIVVLDRSGATRRFTSPGGAYSPPPAERDGGAGDTLAQLGDSVMESGRRAEPGLVRGVDGATSVEVELFDENPALLEFTTWSSFSGVMTCDYAVDGGARRFAPLGDGEAVRLVEAKRFYDFPLQSHDDWPEVGRRAQVEVRCRVLGAETWARFQPHWRATFAPAEAAVIMEAFAELVGGAYAEGRGD